MKIIIDIYNAKSKNVCLCLYPKHYQDIKNFNYVPVGVVEINFQING